MIAPIAFSAANISSRTALRSRVSRIKANFSSLSPLLPLATSTKTPHFLGAKKLPPSGDAFTPTPKPSGPSKATAVNMVTPFDRMGRHFINSLGDIFLLKLNKDVDTGSIFLAKALQETIPQYAGTFDNIMSQVDLINQQRMDRILQGLKGRGLIDYERTPSFIFNLKHFSYTPLGIEVANYFLDQEFAEGEPQTDNPQRDKNSANTTHVIPEAA